MKHFLIAATVLSTALVAVALDWPVINGNADHTGVTDEQLQTPLALAWEYEADHPPAPVSRGMQAAPNANKRAYLAEPIAYDYVFHSVIQSNRLFFGSSTEEAVICLDATTGARQWIFRADGAVRHAPVLHNGNLFFGSDDGRVYCLNAASGEELWRFQAGPSDYRCIGNQRLVSPWPIRTSLAITNDTLYFAGGVYPSQGSYLYALNATTRAKLWEQQIQGTPNGLITFDGSWLWMSTGKTSPMEFNLADGTPRVAERDRRAGPGSWFVGKVDGLPVYGPGDSEVVFFRLSTNAPPERWSSDKSYDYPNAVPRGILSGLNGYCALADSDRFYLLGRNNDVRSVLLADFRSAVATRAQEIENLSEWDYAWQAYAKGEGDDAAFTADLNAVTDWQTTVSGGQLYRAIVAGTLLFLGGVDQVVALNAATSKQVWSVAVDGEARGLAVADGALYVSTDAGKIYCFKNGATDPVIHSPSFSNPYSSDPRYEDAAQMAIDQAGRTRGCCLMIGVGDGQLAYEIAQRSELFVVAIDPDADAVAAARTNLAQAGLYGKQVVVYHAPTALPDLAGYFANLIVSGSAINGGGIPYSPDRILRMLQPYGGTIVFGADSGGLNLDAWIGRQLSAWTPTNGTSGITWQVARRGDLPGAGEWSHHFGNPANTVNTGEERVSTNLHIQWFGPPGARGVIERHSYAMPALVKNGKMYTMTGNRSGNAYGWLTCTDVYNGTALWTNKTVGSQRKRAPINTHSYACIGDQHLFSTTEGDCLQLDDETGSTLYTYSVTLPGMEWGYLGAAGNRLIGTSQEPEASHGAGNMHMSSKWGTFTCQPSCSKDLFVYNTDTHERLWTYTGGAILDVSITVNTESNVIYFVESRNSTAMSSTTGLIEFGDFLQREGSNGAQIVALDLDTGEALWPEPKPITRNIDKPYQWIMYLTYADGVLLASRTYDQTESDGKLHFGYDFEGLDAATGDSLWNAWNPSPTAGQITGLSNGKNAMNSHPFYLDGKFYFFARTYGVIYGYDRLTGVRLEDPTIGTGWEQKEGKSCTPPVVAGSSFYFRFNSQYQYDMENRVLHDLTRVSRPGCWMSIIPAQGLVVMPEASSGCTCGFPQQQTVVLAAPDIPPPDDADSDGIADEWEQRYFGGDADPLATCSNGVNSTLEAYIAGLDPMDPGAQFILNTVGPLQWTAVSGRVYSIYWTSNLLSSFQPLETDLTGGVFTDLTHGVDSKGFYKIDVRLD